MTETAPRARREGETTVEPWNDAIYIPVANANVAGIDKDLNRIRDLKREAEKSPNSGQTWTIIWLGYDSPNKVLVGGALTAMRVTAW